MSKIYEEYRTREGNNPDLTVESDRVGTVAPYPIPDAARQREFSQLANLLQNVELYAPTDPESRHDADELRLYQDWTLRYALRAGVKFGEAGVPVLLRDVARVTLAPEVRRSVSDLDGNGGVVGGFVIMR